MTFTISSCAPFAPKKSLSDSLAAHAEAVQGVCTSPRAYMPLLAGYGSWVVVSHGRHCLVSLPLMSVREARYA